MIIKNYFKLYPYKRIVYMPVKRWYCLKKHINDTSSVSSKEMDQFRALSPQWWKPGAEFEALRTMNKLRVDLVKTLLHQHNSKSLTPLERCSILDVGCGGGILAEPLARLGGQILAIDPLQENISVGESRQTRLVNDLSTLEYRCTSVEDLAAREDTAFDLVIASEVLEHVSNPSSFLRNCCSLVKPGGHVLLTTINRSLMSSVFVKYASEYVMRLVPPGTHDENQFVTTQEMTDYLRESDMHEVKFHGLFMNPITLQWSYSPSTMMNYSCHARKPT